MEKYKKILLVDDDVHLLTELRSCLIVAGYEVFPALDGKQGLSLFKVYNFPVVITDIMMPEMNGLDFLNVINSINPMTNVIIISAYGDKMNIMTALKFHAYNFIEKQILNLNEEVIAATNDAFFSYMKSYGFKDYSYQFKKMLVDGKQREVINELLELKIIDDSIQNTLWINMAFLTNVENQRREFLIDMDEYNRSILKINNNLVQVIDILVRKLNDILENK